MQTMSYTRGVDFLEGPDNVRLIAKLHRTGSAAADHLFQSFAVRRHDGDALSLRPGHYLDESTGALIDVRITANSLSGRCMHCHESGSNLKPGHRLRKNQERKVDDYLQIATRVFGLPAGKVGSETRAAEKLRQRMLAEGPSMMLPLEKLRSASRNYLKEIRPQFENRYRFANGGFAEKANRFVGELQ